MSIITEYFLTTLAPEISVTSLVIEQVADETDMSARFENLVRGMDKEENIE